MRGVFKQLGRSGVLLVLVSVLVAHAADARGRRNEPGWEQRLGSAKRFIVAIFSRFGWPPGEPSDDSTLAPGGLSTPAGDE